MVAVLTLTCGVGFGEKGKAVGRKTHRADVVVIQARVGGTSDEDGCSGTFEK